VQQAQGAATNTCSLVKCSIKTYEGVPDLSAGASSSPRAPRTWNPESSAINQHLLLRRRLIPNIGRKPIANRRHRRDHWAVYALGIFHDISLVL
jgi:hypothetical protein